MRRKSSTTEVRSVATTRQVQAAKRNIKRAQRAARTKKTITKLPAATRRDLGMGPD
jgi:hypothetical protein